MKHFFQGRNEHAIHSPFLFDFYNNAIKGTSERNTSIERLRGQLYQSRQIIEVSDFGAGSKIQKTNQRAVSSIARNALTPESQCLLLQRILTYLHVKTTIELGTSLGISALYFAMANHSENEVYTLEGCPAIASIAQQNFSTFKSLRIHSIVGNFDETFPEILTSLPSVDAIFFDGNHTKEATMRYFEQALNYIHNDTVFIFDDIYWSKGMEEAWKEIVRHQSPTLTIDLFDFGLVFFRKNQPKQHFKLKW